MVLVLTSVYFVVAEAKAQQNVLLKKLLATPKVGQDPATLAAARQILDVSMRHFVRVTGCNVIL